VGPVAAFTPWNFTVNLPSRKLGGALAAGCSVIIKPAEETPASCMLIVEAFHDAGLPPGVINMLCGEPAKISSALLTSEPIRKASFTGSVAVGKMLGELAARGMKRYTAELGGHAPVIVCADADIARAAKLAVTAKFRNAGQVCASPSASISRILLCRISNASLPMPSRSGRLRSTKAKNIDPAAAARNAELRR
jgi:succinate-semialdehyde dehydrogenase/glutarate-semialdehyde dehydrogenase